MSQAYQLPTENDHPVVAVRDLVGGSIEAVRTAFSGATEPSMRVPYQLWADTTSGFLKIRNAANTAWVKVAPLATAITVQLAVENWFVASLAATRSATKLALCPRAGTIKRLVLLCETASTSSSGNEWQPVLAKRPNSAPATPVNLFSGAVGTFTALGGVGGGAEFVAHQALVFTPNQNATVADLDVLELTMTKVGSATTLANFRAFVEME
jgi:hypothetical protein